MGAQIMDILANYDPSGFEQRHRLGEAEIAQRQASAGLTQATTQEKQLTNQSLQIQLRDQDVLSRAFRDGGGDPNQTGRLAIQYGISPQGFMNFRDAHLKLRQATANATKADLENEGRVNDMVGAKYNALLQLPPDQRAAAAPDIMREVQQIDPSHPPPSALDDATLKTEIAKRNYYGTVLKQSQEQAQIEQTKAATAKTAADTAAELRARGLGELSAVTDQAGYDQWKQRHPEIVSPGAYSPQWVQSQQRAAVPVEKQPEYDIKKMQVDAAKSLTPESLSQMVGGSVNAKKYPEQYQRTLNDAGNALRSGLGMTGVQAAIKDGSDRIASRENAIAQAQVTSIPFREAQLENQHFNQLQRSYQFHAAELDKLTTPVMQLNERIQRLNDTIAQGTPQADALVAPELLSVMSGGQGSGLRMNEAEIARIVGGRSKWETLKASINQWQLDPSKANSITPEQRQEVRALVNTVNDKANKRLSVVMSARSALAGASGPEQHRAILADTNNKLAAAVSEQPQNAAAGVIYARDPQGKLHQAAAGTPLPAGWKPEKQPEKR